MSAESGSAASGSAASETSFDLVVVGGGPGGYVAAIRAAQLGMRAAVVEREHLGGICLNWGCIPTKALLRSAEISHLLHHLDEFGFAADNVRFDLAKVVQRSRAISKQLASGVGFLLKKNKVAVFDGSGALAGPGKVEVTRDGRAVATLEAPHIILATGARARVLPGFEPDGALIWTYREAMVPATMPERLLVIGSGAIGIEFASFYRNMGAEVTVAEALPRILPVEDEEIALFAHKAFERQGIRILTGAEVGTPEKRDGVATVAIGSGGKTITESYDKVILAVGIVGNVEGIGIEETGVVVERTHVVIDAFCRTGETGVYAIGDLAGAPWGAPPAPPPAGGGGGGRGGRLGGGGWRPHLAPPRGGGVRRGDRRPRPASDRLEQHPGLHLLPAAGGLRGPDRGQGEGGGAHGQGRTVPVRRQRQGDRDGRDGGHGQDRVRRRHGRTTGGPSGGR